MKRLWYLALIFLLVGGAISLQAQDTGVPVPNIRTLLLRDATVLDHLQIKHTQRDRLHLLLDQIDYPLWRLRDQTPARRDEPGGRLLRDLDHGLMRILNQEQRRAYEQLIQLGMGQSVSPAPPIDWSQVRRRACRAPELTGISAWINSPPLTLVGQRGKVVVLHFFTSNCGNCVANFQYYNRWHAGFDPNHVKMLGIHRPEFANERPLERVRQKLNEYDMTFPVIVDNDSKNWDAWANPVWPSIYLIDKAGFIRYWWYGELQYQGRQGDRWIRTRINELKQEKP